MAGSDPLRVDLAGSDPLRVDLAGSDPLVVDLAGSDPLVDRARRGDRDAFEQLVKVTSADAYALAFRLTGNEHDARDVVQEAYLRAFRSIRKFRGDASFTTWLYRITANCSATLYRRGRGAHLLSIDADPGVADLPSNPDSDALASSAAQRDQVVRALSSLPATLRAVVVLRDVYDLSHDEIAGELGISGAATRVRLHRARRQLRTALFPDQAAEPSSAGSGGTPPPLPATFPTANGAGDLGKEAARAV